MKIKKNVKLAKYATFHVGGPARYFAEVKNLDELREAVSFAKDKKIKIFVLGGGSNTLISDKGINGLVLKINFRGIKFRNGLVSIWAGEIWDDVVKKAVANNLWGIENLSLIPGTVGGAVYQNIGAYGVELKDVLDSVEVLDTHSGSIKKLFNKECLFGYRWSMFQQPEGQGFIILKTNLKLSKKTSPNIKYPNLIKYFEGRKPGLKEIRRAVIKIRKSKLVYPDSSIGTAGSFFKNPVIAVSEFKNLSVKYPDIIGRETADGRVKLFAGQLVEKTGWKGRRFGNVGVSEKHAMVLVRYKGGGAGDVIKLSGRIQESVRKKFGVILEPEVKMAE